MAFNPADAHLVIAGVARHDVSGRRRVGGALSGVARLPRRVRVLHRGNVVHALVVVLVAGKEEVDTVVVENLVQAPLLEGGMVWTELVRVCCGVYVGAHGGGEVRGWLWT